MKVSNDLCRISDVARAFPEGSAVGVDLVPVQTCVTNSLLLRFSIHSSIDLYLRIVEQRWTILIWDWNISIIALTLFISGSFHQGFV